MGATEIVLLVLGIIVFVVSFVLPAKKEKLSKESLQEAKEEIQRIVDEAVKEANSNIEDNVTEVSEHNVEKAERAMERLCNEKIMAINEYSSTVLESIDKNHKEVMFLYDMLNDKHNLLKETVMEADKTAKEVKQTVKDASIDAKEVKTRKSTKKEKVEQPVAKEDIQNALVENIPESVENMQPAELKVDSLEQNPTDKIEEKEDVLKQLDIIKSTKTKQGNSRKKTTKSKEASAPDLNLGTSVNKKDNNRNSNERILQLHNEGKSNVAIAKELGLGLGEVKLVIDLFEGM